MPLLVPFLWREIMQQVRDEEGKGIQIEQRVQQTDSLTPEDEYEFSDDPEVIFRREYSKLDTIPLRQPQQIYWPMVWLVLVMFASFIVGAVIGIVTYPTVTVTIIPLSKHVTITTPFSLSVRQLQPVTLTKSGSSKTTGYGHQDAKSATGTLTIYNSLFTTQTIYAGTVFIGQDGVKVTTSDTVTIPANNPPFDGKALVSAYAIRPGSQGNIAAGDIHLVAQGLLIENNPFAGGRDERDFQTVAKADLDNLTTSLQKALSQQIPQAFTLPSNYSLYVTHCRFTSKPDHQVGEEAQTLTVKVVDTCNAVAYDQNELQQKATSTFTSTRPGANYQLIGNITSKVLSISPMRVQIMGTWVYLLPEDYEQFLAQQVAGETPAEAKKYLLSTGFILDATIPISLPKDPGHIHFEILIGA
jgi:hypothetical protein